VDLDRLSLRRPGLGSLRDEGRAGRLSGGLRRLALVNELEGLPDADCRSLRN
jgi:hypothetical protein